jgi:hypothetical protein
MPGDGLTAIVASVRREAARRLDLGPSGGSTEALRGCGGTEAMTLQGLRQYERDIVVLMMCGHTRAYFISRDSLCILRLRQASCTTDMCRHSTHRRTGTKARRIPTVDGAKERIQSVVYNCVMCVDGV